MGTLSINSSKLLNSFTIDSSTVLKAAKFIDYLESSILVKSVYYNLIHRFTTGFGWSRNLHALCSNQLVTFHLANDIFKAYEFFSDLYVGQAIYTDTWNQFVEIQHTAIDALNYI